MVKVYPINSNALETVSISRTFSNLNMDTNENGTG
jgi:hypothetical protein